MSNILSGYLRNYQTTPAEKAHVTRYMRLAKELAAQIATFTSEEQVVAAFRAAKGSPAVKADAFWVMDEKPGLIPNHTQWHPLLRRTRNNPTYGRELFALWSKS
jgi:hypothetical protein